MSKYHIDLDYVFPSWDISEEELNEIIHEAGRIITEDKAPTEKLAEAWLKKGQALAKIEQFRKFEADMADEPANSEKQEEIKRIIEKALELSPGMPQAILRMGNIMRNLDRHTEAIDYYIRAIQVKPDYQAAFNNRAKVYASLAEIIQSDDDPEESKKKRNENKDRAIADYSEAIRLRPDIVSAYYNRGNFYIDLGEYDKAIADFSEVIRRDSDALKTSIPFFITGGGLTRN
jgi:tetratricopeptide (TPR) repeat protein